MLKNYIHAVFFSDSRRIFCTIVLALALLGCVKNEERLLIRDYISVSSNQIKEEKIAYLTFDDGPSQVTEEVLDILKENDIKATFFVIGQQITEERVPLLRRMVEEGHIIGIHTYTHDAKTIYSSADAYIDDAMRTAERIYQVTSIKPKYYRFPWGSVNMYLKGIFDTVTRKMEEQGYVYYDWNVSGEDSVGHPTKESILKNVTKDYVRFKEPIILLHDSAINEVTVRALPEVIARLKKDNYRFETIDAREKPYQYPKK